VLAGAVVGRDCNVGDHCYVEGGAVLGDAVTLKNGVAVWNGVTLGRGVFVGPNASFTNDLRPRSRAPWRLARTLVEEGATIGANATVLCGLTIGAHSMVGAGAVVTRSVPRHALVIGNPGRVRGYVCRCGQPLRRRGRRHACAECGRTFALRASGLAEVPVGAAR
jgi:acetyltransferase-like isoleucine patch superfamily enzyme